jgi:DNA replication and repair protein RecF
MVFDAPVSCIIGKNGSGKTNLLDAAYYLCYTKSYFTASQAQAVMHGCEGFRLEGDFDRGDGIHELVTCKWSGQKKEIAAGGVAYDKPTDHVGRYAAVMIAPDDLELINMGSEGRRKWVDGILCQTNKVYFEAHLQYRWVLAQRNAWLKNQLGAAPAISADLEYYNHQLTTAGTYINQERAMFMQAFVPILSQHYEELSGGQEDVEAIYESDLAGSGMRQLLEEQYQQDLRLQRTSRGVHRDDISFMLSGKELKVYGSQGQKKSYLFALKLAQHAYLAGIKGRRPMLLLDDIFEKLDQTRMESLLGMIKTGKYGQVIITDTHEERVEAAFGGGGMHLIRLGA